MGLSPGTHDNFPGLNDIMCSLFKLTKRPIFLHILYMLICHIFFHIPTYTQKRINYMILYIVRLWFTFSEKIFLDMRKTIDRLQHLNEKDIIPTKLLKSKNVSEVTSFIFGMIRNDEVYGRFDKPVDDEPRYVAQISETAEDRFKKFLSDNYQDMKMSTTRFPLKGYEELNEVNYIYSNFDGYINIPRFKDISSWFLNG